MHRVSKLKLAEVTPYLVCKLCNGYFIDPCTAQDCLHTFCKTCIVTHLYHHCTCPICGVVIHKTRPLEMIRHDQTMQDLVYKLVPGVFRKEMERRREFYADHPDPDPNTHGNSEERGEVKDDREILAEDDSISMTLVHSPTGDPKPTTSDSDSFTNDTVYLRCPANFPVSGIKKLIRAKLSLSDQYMIDVFHSDDSLSDDYTLMDIAYIYTWRRRGPLQVFYTLYQFDPSAADNQRVKPVSPSEQQQACKVAVFEVTEGVTITETLSTPKTEQAIDSKQTASADVKPGLTSSKAHPAGAGVTNQGVTPTQHNTTAQGQHAAGIDCEHATDRVATMNIDNSSNVPAANAMEVDPEST